MFWELRRRLMSICFRVKLSSCFLVVLVLVCVYTFLHYIPKNVNKHDFHSEEWISLNKGKQDPPKVSTSVSTNILYDRTTRDDRITAQLEYTIDHAFSNLNSPTNSSKIASAGASKSNKIVTILLYNDIESWKLIPNGRHIFLQEKCKVNTCHLHQGNPGLISAADVVVFDNFFMDPSSQRPSEQLWLIYLTESPFINVGLHKAKQNPFNLTATYRHDSDIVTPYGKWVYFDQSVFAQPQTINYALGKLKKVAMIVSNCHANNNRLQYAHELGDYIQVDIYGNCGNYSCDGSKCFEMLSKDYKFLLAFENANCRDYITEKFFVNALGNNILQIVMGAHPNDYKHAAPSRSYIHVEDFSSPKELAEYLHKLDENDDLYNEYFQWKGTGEFINTHFFCRLCAIAHYVLHHPEKTTHKRDFNQWWNGQFVCTNQSWQLTPDIFADEN